MLLQFENACWSQTEMLTIWNSILKILILKFLHIFFFKWTTTLKESTQAETIWNGHLRNRNKECGVVLVR